MELTYTYMHEEEKPRSNIESVLFFYSNSSIIIHRLIPQLMTATDRERERVTANDAKTTTTKYIYILLNTSFVLRKKNQWKFE